MKLYVLTVDLLMSLNIHLKAQSSEDSIIGIWETNNKDARMEIFNDSSKFKIFT